MTTSCYSTCWLRQHAIPILIFFSYFKGKSVLSNTDWIEQKCAEYFSARAASIFYIVNVAFHSGFVMYYQFIQTWLASIKLSVYMLHLQLYFLLIIWHFVLVIHWAANVAFACWITKCKWAVIREVYFLGILVLNFSTKIGVEANV